MRTTTAAAVTVAVLMSFLLVSSVRTQRQVVVAARCLHDGDESPANRERREQALALAKAINDAEGQSSQRTRRFQPLQQLGSLPPTPDGFVIRLYTDGDGYIFSIKDDRDACQYGVFSGSEGVSVSVEPHRAPRRQLEEARYRGHSAPRPALGAP